MQKRQARKWDREADLRAIRDTYDRYAEVGRDRLWDGDDPGYARLAAQLQASLLETLAASIPRGPARIVDLGCGDGSLAADVAIDASTDWIGVDLRPDVIETARERFPALSWLVSSADAVPIDAATVDVVVARLLFSSLPSADLEAAVAGEIARLVRPGGWLVWLDIRYANPTNRAVHGLSKSDIGRLFPDWRQELRSSGLLPPLARRLGPASRLAYPALSALPMLRSHLVGRLRRPDDSR